MGWWASTAAIQALAQQRAAPFNGPAKRSTPLAFELLEQLFSLLAQPLVPAFKAGVDKTKGLGRLDGFKHRRQALQAGAELQCPEGGLRCRRSLHRWRLVNHPHHLHHRAWARFRGATLAPAGFRLWARAWGTLRWLRNGLCRYFLGGP